MFEAVHGSAPDIAGKDVANPSGLIQAAAQMLVHVGQPETAETIENAWLTTLEDGIHTADIYREGLSRQRVGTDGFTDAVIERLGETPRAADAGALPARRHFGHRAANGEAAQGARRRRRLPRLVTTASAIPTSSALGSKRPSPTGGGSR